jgi:hypothetical protein
VSKLLGSLFCVGFIDVYREFHQFYSCIVTPRRIGGAKPEQVQQTGKGNNRLGVSGNLSTEWWVSDTWSKVNCNCAYPVVWGQRLLSLSDQGHDFFSSFFFLFIMLKVFQFQQILKGHFALIDLLFLFALYNWKPLIWFQCI